MSPEDIKLLPFVVVGGAAGAWKYYVRPEVTSKRSWAVLAGFVALHEVFCEKGETLSEGVDKALETHPVLTRAVIGITALHLANLLPPQADPFHQLHKLIKGEEDVRS